jgi:hypothetical protein
VPTSSSCTHHCGRSGQLHGTPSAIVSVSCTGTGTQDSDLARLTLQQLRAFLANFVSELRRHAPPVTILCCARDALAAVLAEGTGQAGQPGVAPAPATERGPGPQPAVLSVRGPAASASGTSLRLGHQCRSQTCADAACALCEHNPVKRCPTDLRTLPYTYTNEEAIVPRCGASLFLHLIGEDGTRRQELPAELQGCSVMITALDQRRYLNAAEASGGADALAARSDVQSVALPGADNFLILRAPDGASHFVPATTCSCLPGDVSGHQQADLQLQLLCNASHSTFCTRSRRVAVGSRRVAWWLPGTWAAQAHGRSSRVSDPLVDMAGCSAQQTAVSFMQAVPC